MNKNDFIGKIYLKLLENFDEKKTKGGKLDKKMSGEIKKSDVALVIGTFIDVLGDSLAKGEIVKLSPLGTFMSIHKKERKARNPKTSEIFTVRAGFVPKLRFGFPFKHLLNFEVPPTDKKGVAAKKGKK